VIDASGLPLAGATVAIRGATDRVTKTDAEGRFEFRVFPKGTTS
jgi:hypothetical protein